MKKNIIFSILLAFLSTSLNAQAKYFEDVPYDYWDYSSINKITDNNIMNGITEKEFMPKKYITRAEYAEGIIKAIKQQDIAVENTYLFDDVNNKHKAWSYIVRALDLDIMKPVSKGHFKPDGLVKREEIIIFLVNILKSEDITKKEALSTLKNSYLDYEDVRDWFKETAGKAEVLGVIAKEPPREKYLDSNKYITRAQFAYFLDKLTQTIETYQKEQLMAETSPKFVENGGIIINNTIQDEDIVTIPVQTVLPVEILKYLKSGKTPSGTMFQVKFANNIIDEERHLLLSKDIVLIGKVLSSEKSIPFIKNGSLIFELSATNKNGNLTRIMGLAECEPPHNEANKFTQVGSAIIKGKNFTGKDGQVFYIRLYQPMRINIVTGEIL